MRECFFPGFSSSVFEEQIKVHVTPVRVWWCVCVCVFKCVFLARGKFESFQRNLDDTLENNMLKTFRFKNNLCFKKIKIKKKK